MDFLKSIIVWFSGLLFMGIFFPVTFIIWLIVLPFDRKRIVMHWLLVYQSLLMSSIIRSGKLK